MSREWLIIRALGYDGAGYRTWMLYRHYESLDGAKQGLEKLRQAVERAVEDGRVHPDRLKSFDRDTKIIEVVDGDVCWAMRKAGVDGKLLTTGRYARASIEC